MSEGSFALIIFLLIALFVKHFFVDFVFQFPWMYLNKGKWLHPGGLLHALFHAFITFTIVSPVLTTRLNPLILIVVGEFVIHYLMDFTKVNVCNKFGWKCNTHSEYWIWLGVDQLVHALTYIAILAVIMEQFVK